jgi:chromate reductase
MTKVCIIVGSLRTDSANKKLGLKVKDILENKFQAEGELLEIGGLPLFNEDLEADFPAVVQELKNKVESSDRLIFITPEYNRSIPSALKNAIDWVSRPNGKNSFAGKKVLCMGVSSGRLGTVSAQHDLKKILLYLSCQVVGQPEIYVGEYKIEDEKVLGIVEKGLQVLLA